MSEMSGDGGENNPSFKVAASGWLSDDLCDFFGSCSGSSQLPKQLFLIKLSPKNSSVAFYCPKVAFLTYEKSDQKWGSIK